MTDKASLEALARGFDAHGANLSRWPQDLADGARSLLARSEEAREIARRAASLDELVERAARSEASGGLAFRIVGEVAARRADRLNWLIGSPRRFGFASASFCGAALAIGVALGAISGPAMSATSLDLGVAFEVAIADGDL